MSNNNGNFAGRKLDIWLDCIPPMAWGKNQKSSFNGRVVTNQRIKTTKELMVGLLEPERPGSMFVGPMILEVIVVWPYLASERKARATGRQVLKTTRPDGDNILATIKDVMQFLKFFQDDSEISIEHMERYYGAKPGIQITLIEVDPS